MSFIVQMSAADSKWHNNWSQHYTTLLCLLLTVENNNVIVTGAQNTTIRLISNERNTQETDTKQQTTKRHDLTESLFMPSATTFDFCTFDF